MCTHDRSSVHVHVYVHVHSCTPYMHMNMCTVPVNKKLTFDDRRTIVLGASIFVERRSRTVFSSVLSSFRSIFVPFSFRSACEPARPV